MEQYLTLYSSTLKHNLLLNKKAVGLMTDKQGSHPSELNPLES